MKKTLYCLLFSFFSVRICQGCLNITLHNVTFNATNFEYMLQWSKDTLLTNVSFSVQCMRYGHDDWLFVPQCENITNTSCNLTDAIIGDVDDFMENEYYGRVRGSYKNCSSKWVVSKRLNPREDTYLVLPKLSYTQHVRSITILVLTPSVKKREDSQPINVEELYRDRTFKYHLRVFSPEKQDALPIIQKDRKFEISGLNPNTEYNGSVYITIGDKRKSDIQYFTVKTLPDLSLVTLISILTTVSAAVLFGVLLYFCCKYIKQEAKIPSSLDLEDLRRISQVMSLPTVECSPCSLGLSPPLYDPHILQAQSGNDQSLAYARQQPTYTLQAASVLPMQTSIYKHQTNCKNEVPYGDVFEEKNPTRNLFNKTSYNSQKLQENIHQPLLDENSATWKEFKNTIGVFNLFSLIKEEPNIGLDLMPSLGLISSLMMDGVSEFREQEEKIEGHSLVLLSDLNNAELAENDLCNDNSVSHESSKYKRQHVVNSHISVTGGNLVCEQPYRIQHFSHIYQCQ